MTFTAENIEQSNQIGQRTTDLVSLMFRVLPSDTEKSIARKIDDLTALKDHFVTNIDIDTLPTDEDELNFLNLISSITEQIQIYEILIGRKKIENLRRAGQNLGRRQRRLMGIID